MSSTACCMSRHPPSPDGIAPRPAVSSPPVFKLPPKAKDLISASWSSGSRLSKPEDAAAIQAIFEKDKPDHEGEYNKAVSKKTSATLGAVKNRLRKHLSKDSGVANTKRHSRSSVGTTEEEVERRAELRRIRHKRIQEELSSEGIYDDDAKSLSTVDAPNTSGIDKRSSWAAGNPLPLPILDLPSLTPVHSSPTASSVPPPTTLFNQKGPMLEALYYGLLSPLPTTSMPRHEEFFADWSTTVVNSSATRSRRHSSPAASSPEFEIPEPNVYRPTRKRSSLPQLPKAPSLQPQRLPSIVEPPKSSWRLSFSADNRGAHLRKLSQGTDIPSLLNPEILIGGPQPMRRWLHSQGLRSSSQAAALSEHTSSPEYSASHGHTYTATQDYGGVDGVEDTNALHLHEMGISRRLASKDLQSACSSPQLSSIGSRTHQRGVSSISAISRGTHKSRGRHLQNTTDSLPLSERIPEAWGNILENGNTIRDGTSSFYPSATNSIQPSPQSSRFNLFSLLAGSKSKTDLTALKGRSVLSLDQVPDIESSPSTFLSPIIPQTPLSRGSIAIASASSSSLPLPFAGYHRRPTIDTNSTIVSETESFREREAELIVVRTRFAAAEASRSPNTLRSSKFREDFEFTVALSIHDPMASKPSAFSRLAKFAARSFDGPFEKKMGIPLKPMTPAFDPSELHHNSKHTKGPLSPIASPWEDDSVVGLWGNAVKRNAEPKTKVISSNLRIPGLKGGLDTRKRGSRDSRKKSHVSTSSKDKKKFALKGLGWGMGDKESGSESEEEVNAEDDWEAELARVAQKAKGKSRAIVKKSTEPDRRYPASWSKFSSHDRDERTSSALANDRVEVKDFATDGSEFLDRGKKTLREKIQKRLVAEFDKQATMEVQNNTEGTFGRRSSMRPAGDLEFPELEVLPLNNVSLMSHEEIADHVEEVMKQEELDKKEEELDAIFGPVKPMKKIENEPKPTITKRVTAKVMPQRLGTGKGGQKESSQKRHPAESTTVVKTETNPSAGPPAEVPVKKGPPTKRGPVARKPGEQSTPKPSPKIAPAVPMPTRGRVPARDFMDGSMDHGDEDSTFGQIDDSKLDEGEISIADPKFYEDCIVNKTPGLELELCSEASDGEGVDEMSPSLGSKKGKYRTWSGRDWDKYRHHDRRSLGNLMLRKSTDEVLCELEKLEQVERENALRLAEEAWGGH